ncbi:hypothetical protein HYU95_03320 [Candidatus Daviesbacteria bacterium]|nr:hypothetical protein [Candidatus Daviesbacteria bacterium]
MSPEGLNRGEKLLGYVQESIRRLEAGEITRLPTGQALANQFGYEQYPSVYSLLKRHGIKLSQYEVPFRPPEPSVDLAWFLGTLSNGGYVHSNGNIRMMGADRNVLEKFRLLTDSLFSLNTYEDHSGTGKELGYAFNSRKVARFLGDLRSDAWAGTISSTHPWVVMNPRYIWGFVTGFFDRIGKVIIDEDRGHYIVTLPTSSQGGASLLAEMLVRVDIRKPSIQNKLGKTKDVSIFNLMDIRLFAQHVHSVVPEKEANLEYYRERFPKRFRITEDSMIQEWKDMSEVLGHAPTMVDIDEFYKAGKITTSLTTFRRRFGNGSFVKAREELERIIRNGQ